jgi:LacI family transcriptional regulator
MKSPTLVPQAPCAAATSIVTPTRLVEPDLMSGTSNLVTGNRPVMQADIGRILRISQVTVSLALRNHPTISEARRKQIQDLAREMGYRPNPAASTLAQFRKLHSAPPVQASLAWINGWPDPNQLRAYREFDGYWRGAVSAAEEAGYRLEEFHLNPRLKPRQLQRILIARGVAGILVPPHAQPRSDWTDFDWGKFSVVRFGRTVGALPVHSVTADQAANGLLAFNEILARGYRRIGFVGYNKTTWLAGAGFLWAQTQRPSTERLPPFLCPEGEDVERSIIPLKAWMRHNKPDAIVTDVAGLRSLLIRTGYRVPEDVGLASLSIRDCPINAGIDQHPKEIGRVALHTLVSLIHSRETGFPRIYRETRIPGSWVDGSDLPTKASPPVDLQVG